MGCRWVPGKLEVERKAGKRSKRGLRGKELVREKLARHSVR